MPSIVLLGEAAAPFAEALRPFVDTADDHRYVLGIGSYAAEAFRQAARNDVAGVIGIDGEPAVVEAQRGELRAPILGIFAEADKDAAYSFASALSAHGVLNETVVYDGVDRGFVGAHEQATADALRLVRRFMGVPSPE